MIRRTTDVRHPLPCPRCDRRLIPVPAESSVTFHCKSGHELGLPELLRTGSDSLKRALEGLLEEWHREHQSLVELAAKAQRDRLLSLADLFHRHAERLEDRIRVLRQAFSHEKSSAPLEVAQ